MSYCVQVFDAEEVSPAQRQAAVRRFCAALEASLGDADLVPPLYRTYLRLVQAYGEAPGPDVLSDAERLVFDQWQAAETAAVTAAFGPHRYMGDAMYEIRLQDD